RDDSLQSYDNKKLAYWNKLVDDPKWEEEDYKASAFIGLNVLSKYYTLIRGARSCREAWNNLRTEFVSVSNGAKLVLKCQFYEARMEEKDTLLSYLDRLVNISDRLEGHGCSTSETEICYKALSSIPEIYRPITMACMLVPEQKLTVSYLRQQFSLEITRS